MNLRSERGGLSERSHAPQDGWTPLHVAEHQGHAAVEAMLLAAGAVKNVKGKVREGGTGEVV